MFRLGLEVLTGTRLDEVMCVGAFVSGAWTRTGVFGSGRVQGDTREFVGVEGGQNKNERAEAAGTSGSSGETRKTTGPRALRPADTKTTMRARSFVSISN